jgi:hypothetical protein
MSLSSSINISSVKAIMFSSFPRTLALTEMTSFIQQVCKRLSSPEMKPSNARSLSRIEAGSLKWEDMA